MKTIRTFCDICDKEFTDSYWDSQPSHVTIQMSAPAQTYESSDMEHVCKKCRSSINQHIISLKPIKT